eukprot:TRINITY_DN15473_c0_g1_i1.p1 TRINITY_DN15473_c0_g1~~TRINITY_DN15473_c0_g1_i1.p1  ORF type:complete len:621 (-),score=197.62 TRINITY_DN15473_c0_g1_i1:32-1894(-)
MAHTFDDMMMISESLEIQSMFMHGSHHLLSVDEHNLRDLNQHDVVVSAMVHHHHGNSPDFAPARSAIMVSDQSFSSPSTSGGDDDASTSVVAMSSSSLSTSEIDMDQEIARFMQNEQDVVDLGSDMFGGEFDFNFDDFPDEISGSEVSSVLVVEGESLLVVEEGGPNGELLSFDSVDEFTNFDDDEKFDDDDEDKQQIALYTIIGHVMSKVWNHKKYCKKMTSEELPSGGDRRTTICCKSMQHGSEFDFQVEQSSLLGCDCEHKRVYWISIRSSTTYAVVGEVAVTESKVLAPLVLGGFIRISGEVVLEERLSFADGIIPFRISVEANLQFIQDNVEMLTMEQILAFLKLKDMIGQRLGGAKFEQKFCSILAKLSQKAEIHGSRDPQPCKFCQNKNVKLKKGTSKRKSPHPGSSASSSGAFVFSASKPSALKFQKTAGSGAAGSSSTMVQNLLEERRRQRARDLIANCSDKDVKKMTEVIHLVAVKQYNFVIGAIGKYSYNPASEVLGIMDDALSDFMSGKNPLEGIGAMIGVTQAIYQKISDSDGRTSNFLIEIARVESTWRSMFEGYGGGSKVNKKNRLIAAPLAKKLAFTLYSTLERHNSENCALGQMAREIREIVG